MDILIVAGGTGSIALQTGLKELIPHCKITVLTNLYDDGKSTGYCRKVMNILGPSDLRKNQYIQWKNKKVIDKRIEYIFETRFNNLTKLLAHKIIKNCNFDEYTTEIFTKSIDLFFKNAPHEVLNDFNLINIIYSGLFQILGYYETIYFMKDFLQIEDDVVLNSCENRTLAAITKNMKWIIGEANIADYNNAEDYIEDICMRKNSSDTSIPFLDKNAEEAIEKADLIIFSSGSQWSLITIYKTLGFSDAIDRSKAKKIMIMNNTDDTDMTGRDASFIIEKINKYVINFKRDFTIFFNLNAYNLMSDDSNIGVKKYTAFMGYIDGKHHPYSLAYNILKFYYNINFDEDDILMMDFDDTLFSRNTIDKKISIENMEIFNKISARIKSYIVSGNSYDTIKNKISSIFGVNLELAKFTLYCDGGLVEYKNNKITNIHKKYLIPIKLIDTIKKKIQNDLKEEVKFIYKGKDTTGKNLMCLSITGLDNEYRHLLYSYLTNYLLKNYKNLYITEAGKSTIDIYKKNHDKSKIFEMLNFKNKNIIYIGDELESGNDKIIATKVNQAIKVDNVYDTNVLLRLIYNEC
ncbi:2-phospho-L-lactate transferase CofD family protein [Candidatus Dojkabacteria bacterium]|jgi:2-phospho-L-lactate transferase/gluconeogenesis factor (CofD/UPF0052 family)|nr:2-phospho-L-lactate transferase CofD family protein [Candidatus Dojkabacteria bacterium]